MRIRICSAALAAVISLGVSSAWAQDQGELAPPAPPPASDQSLSPPAPVDIAPRLVGISVLAGVMLMDLSPINDRLSDAGYPDELPLAFPMLGGQGFGLFSRFLIGGSGAGLFERTVDGPDGTEVSAVGAWGTFDFGYQAVRTEGFLLAPVLSAGGYGMAVNIADTGDTDFDDAIESPTRATTLTNQGLLGGVSLVANYVVIGRKTQVAGAKAGWALGLRVGGLYGFQLGDWEADGAEASDGPSIGLRGGYAALSLGVGSF